MAEKTSDSKEDHCPSKRSWGEVLGGGLKIFVFNFLKGAGEEGGRSIGKIVLYVILLVVGLSLLGSIADSAFGWFGGWFSWMNPGNWSLFGGGEADVVQQAQPATVESEAADCTGLWATYSPIFNSCE